MIMFTAKYCSIYFFMLLSLQQKLISPLYNFQIKSQTSLHVQACSFACTF